MNADTLILWMVLALAIVSIAAGAVAHAAIQRRSERRRAQLMRHRIMRQLKHTAQDTMTHDEARARLLPYQAPRPEDAAFLIFFTSREIPPEPEDDEPDTIDFDWRNQSWK